MFSAQRDYYSVLCEFLSEKGIHTLEDLKLQTSENVSERRSAMPRRAGDRLEWLKKAANNTTMEGPISKYSISVHKHSNH